LQSNVDERLNLAKQGGVNLAERYSEVILIVVSKNHSMAWVSAGGFSSSA
jgi:hypothetical protein